MVRLPFLYLQTMGVCFDCAPVLNVEEAFERVRAKARDEAVNNAYPVAIVWEGEWKFYNAFFAYQNNYDVKEVVSHVVR